MAEDAKLWRVWWLWGVPVAWGTVVLLLLAESAYDSGQRGWGGFLDLARLALYWGWLRAAWKRSRNVEWKPWTPIVRIALAAGLVIHALA